MSNIFSKKPVSILGFNLLNYLKLYEVGFITPPPNLKTELQPSLGCCVMISHRRIFIFISGKNPSAMPLVKLTVTDLASHNSGAFYGNDFVFSLLRREIQFPPRYYDNRSRYDRYFCRQMCTFETLQCRWARWDLMVVVCQQEVTKTIFHRFSNCPVRLRRQIVSL